MRVSAIITCYNSARRLKLALKGWRNLKEHPFEIIFADDGSTNDIKSTIDDFRSQTTAKVTHVWHRDVGYRRAEIMNKAVAKSHGEYLIMTDGDCVPHPYFVTDHMKYAEPEFFIEGPLSHVQEQFIDGFTNRFLGVLYYVFTGKISARKNALRIPFISSTGKADVKGCNFSCWREDFIRVNGFDERYTGWGLEDLDLVARFINAGLIEKALKFKAITYHLDHPNLPRDQLSINQKYLHEVRSKRKIRARAGLDKHLDSVNL